MKPSYTNLMCRKEWSLFDPHTDDLRVCLSIAKKDEIAWKVEKSLDLKTWRLSMETLTPGLHKCEAQDGESCIFLFQGTDLTRMLSLLDGEKWGQPTSKCASLQKNLLTFAKRAEEMQAGNHKEYHRYTLGVKMQEREFKPCEWWSPQYDKKQIERTGLEPQTVSKLLVAYRGPHHGICIHYNNKLDPAKFRPLQAYEDELRQKVLKWQSGEVSKLVEKLAGGEVETTEYKLCDDLETTEGTKFSHLFMGSANLMFLPDRDNFPAWHVFDDTKREFQKVVLLEKDAANEHGEIVRVISQGDAVGVFAAAEKPGGT